MGRLMRWVSARRLGCCCQHHADDQRNDNIQDAVLLDEHRGGIDKHRQDNDTDFGPAWGTAAAEQPKDGGHAAQYMHTGDDIGVGISMVQPSHQPGKDVRIGKFGRAQVLSIGEN